MPLRGHLVDGQAVLARLLHVLAPFGAQPLPKRVLRPVELDHQRPIDLHRLGALPAGVGQAQGNVGVADRWIDGDVRQPLALGRRAGARP